MTVDQVALAPSHEWLHSFSGPILRLLTPSVKAPPVTPFLHPSVAATLLMALLAVSKVFLLSESNMYQKKKQVWGSKDSLKEVSSTLRDFSQSSSALQSCPSQDLGWLHSPPDWC